jgi:YkoY family integral membrane protein
MIELPFQQTFIPGDLAIIGLLVILEGVLSIDNALVLGLLAKRVPKSQQGRALTYGLVGAFVFRFLAIATAQYLMRWHVVKLLGGIYLIYVAAKYLVVELRVAKEEHIAEDANGTPILVGDDTGEPVPPDVAAEEVRARMRIPDVVEAPVTARESAGFWSTVAAIELTDIAFAVDSILAAIALVGGDPKSTGLHPKLWVVVTGGMLGVILMRFAAFLFIRLLERFPRFERSAYLLVAIIGLKLFVDWGSQHKEEWHRWVNFHDPSSIAFWVFWLLMLAALASGFIPKRRHPRAAGTPTGAVAD